MLQRFRTSPTGHPQPRPVVPCLLGKPAAGLLRRLFWAYQPWRTWVVAALCTSAPGPAIGQGVIVFSTFGQPPNGRISDGRTAQPLAGTNWLAELYWAAGLDRPAASLAPAGAPLTFRTDGGAGYVDNGHDPDSGLRVLPGTQPGDPFTFQVRAWNAVAGTSYEQAASSLDGVVGASNVLNGTAGSSEAPATIVGLLPFSVEPVPEPSALAMLATGLTLLVAHRRPRKCVPSGNHENCR
jgi:hypothetical protein